MYTECSHCNAVFLITAAQMGAAGGQARCGHCGEVFLAREVRLSGWSHAGSEEPAMPELPQAPPEAPQPEPPAVAEPAAPVEGSWPQVAAVPVEEPPAASVELPVEAPPARQGAFAAWRERRAARKARAEVEQDTLPESSSEEMTAEEAMGDETASLDFPRETRVPSDETLTSMGMRGDPWSGGRAQDDADLHRNQAGTESAFESLQAEHRHDGKLDDSSRELMAEMRREGSARGGWQNFRRGVLLLIAIVVLGVLLFGQWLLSDLDNLARFPTLQRYTVTLCEVVGCDPPYLRQPQHVEVVSRNVVSHPSIANALLVSATLVNNADKPQPYPDMELTLTGLQGEVVAQRRFKPQEYVPPTVKPDETMAPDVPIEIQLEIVDPGPEAVAFQFEFR